MSYHRGDVFIDPNGSIMLPHSCDEWVIGTKANVQHMIQDLRLILKDAELCQGYWGQKGYDQRPCDYRIIRGQKLCSNHRPYRP